MKPKEQQNFPDISDKPEAMLVSKVVHTYADTARRLGKDVAWSVLECIYDKTKPTKERHVAMREDLLRARLCKKNKDGQNWSVLYHPLSELWMNDKEDTFKIVYKDSGRVVCFGNGKDGKPYIEWTKE